MERNQQGDKVFSSSAEAVANLRTWTLDVVRWLHQCREQGYVSEIERARTRLNDIANVTVRWIEDRERRLSNPCPHCGRMRDSA